MTSFLLAAEEVGPLSDGGVLAEWAGIMLVSPFIAFLLIIWLGKRMKYEGGEFAVAAMAVNLVIATGLFFQNMRQGILHEVHFEIAKIGLFQGRELVFQLGWIVDGLSIMMYWVVAFVGLLVFLYAIGYMHGEARVTMFFASFSLFAGSMLILVGSPNLIQLIIGWEGVGLASYLLIGHYWEGLDNVRAGNKAFLTNKVADVGLVLGAIFLGMGIGDFGFQAINTRRRGG
jgi:NADH-quinone oxidoreductase subunit L